MKRLLSALAMIALVGGVASASVPYANDCIVSPADGMLSPRINGVLDNPTPSGYADLTVTVKAAGGYPINNCYVEVVLNADCLVPSGPFQGQPTYCMCDGVTLTGYTNASGQVTINLGYGGCCNMGAAVNIKADGVLIRSFDWFVSPDFDGAKGDCVMGLEDFTVFGNAWPGASPGCTDYDGNESTDVVDFTIFGGSWLQYCTPAP